jgi:hypothetical protein
LFDVEAVETPNNKDHYAALQTEVQKSNVSFFLFQEHKMVVVCVLTRDQTLISTNLNTIYNETHGERKPTTLNM